MNKKHKATKAIIVVLLVAVFVTCSSVMTMKDQFKGIKELIYQRNFARAIAQLEDAKAKYYEEKDQVMYYLDLGSLHHYNLGYPASNQMLTMAENGIEVAFTKSITQAVSSYLLNDNALDYAGEDYEDIYLNVFKALNYLHLGSFDDAYVEVKRVNDKLNLLEDKYRKLANAYNNTDDAKKQENKLQPGKQYFFNSALARYLGMLIYRAEGQMDDARIEKQYLEAAFMDQPLVYDFPVPNTEKALQPTDKARLNFICFTGRSPDKTAVTLRIRTTAGGSAIIVPSAENEEFMEEIKGFAVIPFANLPDNLYFKFQLPLIKMVGSRISGVKVIVAGAGDAFLSKIESLEKVAKITFEVKKPIIYLKTIIRTIVKGIVAYAGKEAIDQSKSGIWGFIGKIAVDVAMDVSENADLRVSHFFPAQSYVGELLLDPGVYKIRVEYIGKDGTLIYADDKGEIEIKAKKLNLIESFSLE